MDYSTFREQDFAFDLESGNGVIQSNEEESPGPNQDEKLAKTAFLKLCDGFKSVDNNSIKSDMNEGSQENNVNRKKVPSAKKPPRPPKGFSLDVYDQKLIKELAQLAIIKRARIERMNALKQKKNLKILSSSSSSSTSSNSSLFAMLFTIIFFVVILLQGRSGVLPSAMLNSPCRPLDNIEKSNGRNSGVTLQGSPQMARTNGNGLVVLQNQLYQSTNVSISPSYKS